uniref:BsuBI/PstI family type II restriction endonuclease n=1 Tax=Psychromonas sp. 14N.309.X.WAT.B.A12 TaxID=2998322 RepID=UPI00339DA5CC
MASSSRFNSINRSLTRNSSVDGKCHRRVTKLCKDLNPSLVYVTAFSNIEIMSRYLAVLSWKTDVWESETPSNMIQFNGDYF